MTRTSQQLSLLQDELSELCRLSDSQKVENNKIFFSRLEAMHVKLADMEYSSTRTSFRSDVSDSQGEIDLQHVISYLRRPKEIAETEIALLIRLHQFIFHHLRLQTQERKKFEEIEKNGHSISCLLGSSRIVASQLPYQSGLDEQDAAYFQHISGDASVTGQQVLNQPRPVAQQAKAIEVRERRFTVPKPSVDIRKRKLVTSLLEQSEEIVADVEMLEVERVTTGEKGKHGGSGEQEIQESVSLSGPSYSSRKLAATAAILELKDDFSAPYEDNFVAAPLKRPKGSKT